MSDYVLEAGKFASCQISDVPRSEIRFLVTGRGATPNDRAALREYWQARGERIMAARRAARATARRKAA
jgi:hypothetical protein